MTRITTLNLISNMPTFKGPVSISILYNLNCMLAKERLSLNVTTPLVPKFIIAIVKSAKTNKIQITSCCVLLCVVVEHEGKLSNNS